MNSAPHSTWRAQNMLPSNQFPTTCKHVHSFLVAVASFLLALPSSAFAGYESGSFEVGTVRVRAGGALFALNPAPADCQGGNHWGEHIWIAKTHEQYEVIVSALITAKAANQRVAALWYDDQLNPCANSGDPAVNALNITGIRIK